MKMDKFKFTLVLVVTRRIYGCKLREFMKHWKWPSCHVFPTNEKWIGGRQVKAHLCASTKNAHILQSFHACMKSSKYIHKMGHDSKVWHGSCVVVVPKLTCGKKLSWMKSNMLPYYLKGSFLKHWYGMSGIFPSYICRKIWTIHDVRLPFLNHLWPDFKSGQNHGG